MSMLLKYAQELNTHTLKRVQEVDFINDLQPTHPENTHTRQKHVQTLFQKAFSVLSASAVKGISKYFPEFF